jgi:hypothetical protein
MPAYCRTGLHARSAPDQVSGRADAVAHMHTHAGVVLLESGDLLAVVHRDAARFDERGEHPLGGGLGDLQDVR